MAGNVKVKLLKPLNGAEIGSTAEYSEADAKRLEALGAVERVSTQAKAKAAPKNKAKAAPKNKSSK